MGSINNEYSERVPQMFNHQGQIRVLATAAKGPVYISTLVSYSLAYDAADVMDNADLATAWSAQIQISIALIDAVKKPSVDPLIIPEKAQKTIQATMQREIRTMLLSSLLRQFKTNYRNLHYHCLAHHVF